MSKKISGKYKSRLMKRILPLLGVLAAGAVAAYFVNVSQYREKFVPGTYVDGVNVSEMTPEELAGQMSDEAAAYKLRMKFLNDVTEEIPASAINLKYEPLDELNGILAGQNPYAWLSGMFGRKYAYNLKTEITYDEAKLREAVNSLPELQPDYILEPEDARLKMNTDGTLSIMPEINGNRIEVSELLKEAGKSILGREESLDLVAAEDIYDKPEVLSTDKELVDSLENLNAILGTTVTFKMSDGTDRVLDRSVTSNWLTTDENGGYEMSDETLRSEAAAYIAGLAKEDDNYGNYRTFASTNFGTVRLETEALHGHLLDKEKMADELVKTLESHKDAEIGMTYSKMEDIKDPRFGGTYVEVDILNQHVFFYIDYELYYDGDCVSGLEYGHATPSGIFSIQDKERGRILEGYNSDGTVSYTAYVEYWMCFYPHYGLHDASWRDYFGGDIYLYDGSHGCVNLSRYTASMLYDAIDYDTPVIIFRGQDDYAVPEDEIDPNTEDSIAQ